MHFTKHFFLAFCLALAGCAVADPTDDYVNTQMKRLNIPGLVLLVVQDGKVLKRQAYGRADIEKDTPMTTEMRLDLGSIGKTFTATMIMQLVDEKKVDLDKSIQTYVPDAPDAWKAVTVRQCLSHTSGLPEYALVPGVGLLDSFDEKKWKDTMYKLPLDFEPGLMFAYSNTNFKMLGQIIERLRGKSYPDALQAFVCKPAGMTKTSFDKKDAPTGYFFSEGRHQNLGYGGAGYMNSDGGEFTTVDDLYAFSQALASGKVLKPERVKEMQTAARTASGRKIPYGLGWFSDSVEDNPRITHGGNSVGFAATLSMYPKQKLTIVMLCNVYDVTGDDFALGLARVLAPELKSKPLAESPDPDVARTEKLKAGLMALTKGDGQFADFHEDMKKRLATGRGRMVMGGYRNLAGMTSLNYIDSREDDPDTVFRYRATTAQASWIVEFVVDKSGKIYSIRRLPDPGKPA